ncbi:lipocalin family protein [Mucilaginibacter ximonensis]|uniref:Lipocalin family protein n=1 Tax=Mucilaginibacter ximonensis TaxID=538021 RepID=A0ABW5YA67_9SPHI
MKKTYLLLCLAILAVASCKKDDSTKIEYTKLIVGSWKSTGKNTKVYDLNTDELLKDSTINFTGKNAGSSWFEIYNTDGSSYVTTLPIAQQGTLVARADTTSFLTYAILGNNLLLKQTNGGSTTKPILALSNTTMDLQSTSSGVLTGNWGLDANATYKITVSTHYTRQ